jgi:hypothetical protein
MIFNSYKRDIVEEAQLVMNANKSLDNKNLISAMANEIIACRAQIERLEAVQCTPLPIVPKNDRIEIIVNESGRLEARWIE